MGRLHLFEIEDQSWCPATLRDAATAYLRLSTRIGGQAQHLVPTLARALERSGRDHVLDLCSGGAGPLPELLAGIEAQGGKRVTARLSDLYPNLSAFALVTERSEGRIGFETRPVDAADVPADLDGFRTLFNAFHHFRPEAAQRVLQNAVEAGRPIGVFELVSRTPLAAVGILLGALGTLLLMPFVRPLRASWLLFTYAIPLIPLLVLWDGLVSCLRVYSESELCELLAGVRADGWIWETGRTRLGAAPIFATWLVGLPGAEDA